MKNARHALVLFSGGLDSVLACKVLQEQGLSVLGLHFTSPFFGKPGEVAHMQRVFGVDIQAVDSGQDFVDQVLADPAHGFGKALNPCLDCKIFMISRAVNMLGPLGADFVATGEVVGQRPMSQRRDAMNRVLKESGAAQALLRPLCARHLEPTPMEASGLVDRDRLLAIKGRGRKEQLALARKYGLEEVPSPAGGCLLTESESACRYLPILEHAPSPTAGDFALANLGRQYWQGPHWMAIGRNQADNKALEEAVTPGDLVFRLAGFPGPLAVGRQFMGRTWGPSVVRSAAALAASFSPRARRSGGEVDVLARVGREEAAISVTPARDESWRTPEPADLQEWKKAGTG
jgi:hypothetical protein